MRQEIESISFFQSLMMEENTVSSGKKNKNKKEEKKKRRTYCFGESEQITALLTFSVTLGLLICKKWKDRSNSAVSLGTIFWVK